MQSDDKTTILFIMILTLILYLGRRTMRYSAGKQDKRSSEVYMIQKLGCLDFMYGGVIKVLEEKIVYLQDV